jgi:hypothetical protein
MINFLLAVALILFVIILIIYLVRIMNANYSINHVADFEDEVVTTTTTTTTVTEPVAHSCTIDDLEPLTRFFKPNGQPYCIDPVDGTEWILNTKDDMYEDAGDKWWRLVDANVPATEAPKV